MRFYADLPGRRTAQLLSDMGMLCWVGAWAWVGRQVHDSTLALAAPGRQLQDAGTGLSGRMTDAASAVDDVPLVGDKLRVPFNEAAGVGGNIHDAGSSLITSVERLALLLGWVTALVPILVLGILWALLRLRFIRRASAAQRFIDNAADLDLFALRAMAHQPMRKLAVISDDPTGAWRRGDTSTIRALALLELKDTGLRPPPQD
ncbi:hypothetical protein ACQP1U_09655 [Actinomycetota bacterium]